MGRRVCFPVVNSTGRVAQPKVKLLKRGVAHFEVPGKYAMCFLLSIVAGHIVSRQGQEKGGWTSGSIRSSLPAEIGRAATRKRYGQFL